MTNTELKTNIDAAITNKTSVSSITPNNVGEQIKSTVDYIDQEIDSIDLTPTPIVKISQQINVTTGEPEINAIDYVRIFANDEYQSCKLTGPHTVGKEIYIKNTTSFNVVINGIVEI